MYNSLLGDEYKETLAKTMCRFPKYREREWSWWKVLERDPEYVSWILENIEDLDDDLREALEWGAANV